MAAFEAHCVGEVNVVYERYVFYKRKQENGETFDSFLAELRRLVKTCEFGAVEDSTVRDRIVMGIRDDTTRRKLLQTRKLDLKSAIDICRASESAMNQLRAMTMTSTLSPVTRRVATVEMGVMDETHVTHGADPATGSRAIGQAGTVRRRRVANVGIAAVTMTPASLRAQPTARPAKPATGRTTSRPSASRRASRPSASSRTTSTRMSRSWHLTAIRRLPATRG